MHPSVVMRKMPCRCQRSDWLESRDLQPTRVHLHTVTGHVTLLQWPLSDAIMMAARKPAGLRQSVLNAPETMPKQTLAPPCRTFTTDEGQRSHLNCLPVHRRTSRWPTSSRYGTAACRRRRCGRCVQSASKHYRASDPPTCSTHCALRQTLWPSTRMGMCASWSSWVVSPQRRQTFFHINDTDVQTF